MTNIAELKNLGPRSTGWLREIGISTCEGLEKLGPVEAYKRVKACGHNTSLNFLYALVGGLMGIHWTDVPDELKEQLKEELKEGAR